MSSPSSTFGAPSTTSWTPPAGTTWQSRPNDNSDPSGTSSTLYLYTFLSTLVLLVLISAAIVARSIRARRRHRARIAQALADGTFRPDMLRRGDTLPALFDSMAPPRMFEVYAPPGAAAADARWARQEKAALGDLVPLSAKLLGTHTETPAERAPAQPARRVHTSRLGRYFFPPPPPPHHPAPAPLASDAASGRASSEKHTVPTLSLAVLIAMPDPGSKPAPAGEGGEPPYCELGVVSAPVPGTAASIIGSGVTGHAAAA